MARPSRPNGRPSSSRRTCAPSWSRSAGRATATRKQPKGGLRLTSRAKHPERRRQRPRRRRRRPRRQPAHPGRPLRARAQDAAQGEAQGPRDRRPLPVGRDGASLARNKADGPGRRTPRSSGHSSAARASGSSGRSSRSRPSPSRPSAIPHVARIRHRPLHPGGPREERAVRPPPPADRRTLIRRATFDLIGLPPTPAEIDAFLADDSPEAFARVVDRLLASPHYGERWGRHWLDVVRYADARDLIQLPAESDFREAWRYRDWVVDASTATCRTRSSSAHQVAGDLLPPPHPGGDQQGRARRHRACWPSPTSCPATSTRTR